MLKQVGGANTMMTVTALHLHRWLTIPYTELDAFLRDGYRLTGSRTAAMPRWQHTADMERRSRPLFG